MSYELAEPIAPARRRTPEDHLAVRFPAAYRRTAALVWSLCARFPAGHPARRACLTRVVSRSYGAFNRDDLAALLPLYHPDCRWDWTRFEGWPDELEFRGPEGLRRGWLTFREVWGRFWVDPGDLRDFGDRQMLTCRMRVTGAGSGVDVERFWWQVGSVRDGLVVLVANYSDHDEALEAGRRGGTS